MKHTDVFYTSHIYSVILLVFMLCQDSHGEYISMCYIKRNQNNTDVCTMPNPPVRCCGSGQLSIDHIEVYHKLGCQDASHCIVDGYCCSSPDEITVSEEFKANLTDAFKRTNCFNTTNEEVHVLLSYLPMNDGLYRVVVSYNCRDTDETTITTTAATTTDITATTISSKPSDEESNMNITAAVAVPITIIVVIAVVVVVTLYMWRRAAKKEVEHQKHAPGYMGTGAIPSNYDTVNSGYTEIPDNAFLNVGDPIMYPRTKKGGKDNNPQHGNKDYDHIAMQIPTKSKEGDTYSHIQHATDRNISTGNDGGDINTYEHIVQGSKTRHGVNSRNRDIDVETYDTMSTLDVRRGQGDASGAGHYDHTKQHSAASDIDYYGYSHVTVGEEIQVDNYSNVGMKGPTNTVGTNSQKGPVPETHSYFVLEKQFK